jgi:hypothetical protein
MITSNLQDLKYGIIYFYCNQKRSGALQQAADLLRRLVFPMDIQWVDHPDSDGCVIVARRFNVSNIGRYAIVRLKVEDDRMLGTLYEAIEAFARVLLDMSDRRVGDVQLRTSDYGPRIMASESYCDYLPEAAPQDHTRVKKSKPRLWKSLKKKLMDLVEEELDEELTDSATSSSVPRSLNLEREVYVECGDEAAPQDLLEELEEDLEFKRLERERKQALERIRRDIVAYVARYHEDPKELMAELLQGKVVVGQPGRLLVNGDMKIVLPEYDEMEIEMPASCRTLYILFMKLRKQGRGIILKNIDEHREELLAIYTMVKPGASDERARKTVGNLCDPLCDSLNQTISRINRCIRDVITDAELVKRYIVTGKKGEPYSIALDPQYLELPRAVTGT